MPAINIDTWLPEVWDSALFQRLRANSAVETVSAVVPMTTLIRHVPRSGAIGVDYLAKGQVYGEDAATNDEVILIARKFGRSLRIAEEDLTDVSSVADVLTVKQEDWTTGFARILDNAAIGVNAAEGGAGVPFTSIYRTLSVAGPDGYLANTNKIATAAGGALTYALISSLLGLVENNDYYDPASAVIIAHPSFRARLRSLLDADGRPLFVETTGGGTPGAPTAASLFGVRLLWSRGAKVSATASSSPPGAGGTAGTAGNPLMVLVDSNYLRLGRHSGPESTRSNEVSFLTDEVLVKMRARRAFVLGHPFAAAILEGLA